jgi:hypothetical protein
MPLYHLVFALLLFGAVIEYWQRKTPKILYVVCFLVLTGMLCLRFGQGTDYVSYRMIYYTIPANLAGTINYGHAKAEIGWRLITMLFRMAGLKFEVFVILLSLLQMWLMWRFVKRYCHYRILALFLGYHTLYLTYLFSAMRQGTVIMVFLGLMLPWLLEGKWVRYCVTALLLTTIHPVSLIMLVPAVVLCIRISVKHTVALVAVGFCVGILFSVCDVGLLLRAIVPTYAGETEISVVALAERVASFILVTYMYYLYCDGVEPDVHDPFYKIYKIYAFGILIYGVLMWSPLISSRTIFSLKVLEIPLITTCMVKCRKGKSIAILYLVLLCSVLYLKNISSCITQAEYLNTNVWNYPYYSIWDQEAAVKSRAKTSKYYEWLYKTRR